VFNQDRDPTFKKYIRSLINAKMLEVCSTSLPQYAIPPVMGDARYPGHLAERRKMFEHRVNEAWKILSPVEGVYVGKPRGAFYMPVIFPNGTLNERQKLPIENPRVREYIEDKVRGVDVDKRFVYYLMGATGVCVVPMTGFYCERKGFRVTLLETDDEKRRRTMQTLAENIELYLSSAR